jgi:hypothetical protein
MKSHERYDMIDGRYGVGWYVVQFCASCHGLSGF